MTSSGFEGQDEICFAAADPIASQHEVRSDHLCLGVDESFAKRPNRSWFSLGKFFWHLACILASQQTARTEKTLNNLERSQLHCILKITLHSI
jgi:hypothetical protein